MPSAPLCLSTFGTLSAQEAWIGVDASKIGNPISPWLCGACIEDVNHEIYGGLYGLKIFGESFEEPALGFYCTLFTPCEGHWQPRNGNVAVEALAGAKPVYDGVDVGDGLVGADPRLSGNAGGNAGLPVRVDDPGNGADNSAATVRTTSTATRSVWPPTAKRLFSVNTATTGSR